MNGSWCGGDNCDIPRTGDNGSLYDPIPTLPADLQFNDTHMIQIVCGIFLITFSGIGNIFVLFNLRLVSLLEKNALFFGKRLEDESRRHYFLRCKEVITFSSRAGNAVYWTFLVVKSGSRSEADSAGVNKSLLMVR